MLSIKDVMKLNNKRAAAATRKNRELRRVKVYTLNGKQIGKPGIGEGEERLTFPASFLVGDALNETDWIRTADECDLGKNRSASFDKEEQAKTWWCFSEVQPLGLLHSGADDESYMAAPGDPMGLNGDHMTALETTVEIDFEEKPCCEVDDVPTPTTPSPF